MKQQELLDGSSALTENQKNQQVICLGKAFSCDAERRAYFTKLLAEKLKDPEFRKIEGFPIGNDEDILNLSDPPYYTACPNPWVADFIAQWEDEKPAQPEGYHYHREPFAADVSEGKNDPIYNAHPYHTKVPPNAILNYIDHYTNPGDVILDFTCGTGMVGVASNSKKDRNVILCDLSPVASWISYGTNILLKKNEIHDLNGILNVFNEKFSDLYKVNVDGVDKTVLYTVWSDVFVCSNCNSSYTYWDAALDTEIGNIQDTYSCPSCKSVISKRDSAVVKKTVFNQKNQKNEECAVREPVLVVFQNGSRNERYIIPKDERELYLKFSDVDAKEYPDERIDLDYDIWWDRDYSKYSIFTIDKFFTKRALLALSELKKYSKTLEYPYNHLLMWLLTAVMRDCSLMTGLDIKKYFHGGGGPFSGGVKGTFFIPSLSVEKNVLFALSNRVKSVVGIFSDQKHKGKGKSVISTQSATDLLNIPDKTIDYIFVDPPFGSNFIYSELNMISEAWLSVKTNEKEEAVIHRRRKKAKKLNEYQILMQSLFTEAYRVLKPGHWMTVEFSNTKASVWNSIQSALSDAGFIVANVSALDKKQGSFKAVTTTTAVKQDLVISAYKPNGGFEDRFKDEATTEAGVWDFIRTHLQYLPVVKAQGNSLLQIPERDPRILFDQLVAFYVRKGYPLPVSSQEFQLGLAQRFKERDGMYFLDEQAAEYDKKKALAGELVQTSLFVSDEASAIQWLRQLLKLKPQVFSDINPQFMQQLSGWSKNEVQLDLRDLLTQNFLCYDGEDDVPEQIHSYLSTNWKEYRNLPKDSALLQAKAKDRWYVPDPNKAGDLEKLRERSLLKEFEEYKSAKKKLKVFRIEAVRVGFKKLWEAQEFTSILDISSKLPNDVIAGDPVLLMYYDQAMMLSQANSGEDW
ncbi:DNA methylase [Marisediminitalea aggregata]|uniref:DNA methylase n=1 Tax=Marisediminitalea aggregata TaxID=634436 RepID=A0A1M5N5G1_9ALTE|nr:DNA methyltransferase [Marisediminitalea aggregata]SHG84804.1 DNA methylase [Marisediminitalea aggregata]